MKLCEMHCMFQQYDQAMATNAGASTHHDKLSKLRKVHRMRARMPTPQRAGMASMELWRKRTRDGVTEPPFSVSDHVRQAAIITSGPGARSSLSPGLRFACGQNPPRHLAKPHPVPRPLTPAGHRHPVTVL